MTALSRVRENWLTLLGAFILVMLATIGIYRANLTDGMDVLITIVPLAFIAGTFLALSVFTRRTAILFSLVYGSFFCFLVIGNNHLPEIGSWRERIIHLVTLQSDWIGKLFNGGTSREPLIFIMHTSAVFWMIGHSAAWWTLRSKRIWRVVIPSGVVLLSVVYYYFGPRPLWVWLATYVIASFIYIAFTWLVEQQTKWRTENVFFENSIGFNIAGGSLALAVLTLLFALQVPTLEASSNVNEVLNGTTPAWQKVQNTWTRLFSSLRTYSAPTNDTFADNLSLGGARNVGESLVMDVFVDQELPFAYWHALSYETYEDGLWQSPSGSSQSERIPDDGYFEVPDFEGRQIVTQTVRNYLPSAGQIYGLPDIIGSDRQMFVTSRPLAGEAAGGAEQISMVQSKYVLQQGEVYNSASKISIASNADLRGASNNYPDWTDSYVALPDSVTQRTRDLANELAAPHDNAYDQAIAIQNFLRDHIEYNDQIDAPPDGVEPVDYVLFEVSEGYCNYYSSAMVVMLRHLGIPSRPASGFAAGEFIEDAGLYRVRSKDAHTWVEAWFPDYGWIQFEPTASIAVPARAEGGSSAEAPAQAEENPRDLADELANLDEGLFPGGEGPDGAFPEIEPPSIDLSQFATLPVILATLLIVAAAGISGYTTYSNRKVESDLSQSYARLGQWGDRLGASVSSAQTPNERATVVATVLPAGKKSIDNLTDQFVRSRYSREQTADPDFNPQTEWQELRPLFNKSWVNIKLKQVRRWRSRFF
ncbi:MAG: DUF3488 and DUF4129 domain-containing transglutaminase family protein [Anaerolineae bacterium]